MFGRLVGAGLLILNGHFLGYSEHSSLDLRASQRLQQADATGTVIVGRVVAADTGRALPGVVVRLWQGSTSRTNASGPLREVQGTLTTAAGQFVFRQVPQGAYRLTATYPGYLSGAYGRVEPSGASKTLLVGSGNPPESLTIELWRPGTIGGHVLDETGAPAVSVRVDAVARGSIVRTTTTDDLGAYRLHGLLPGDYLVVVPFVSATVPISTAADDRALASESTAIAQTAERRLSGAPSTGIPGIVIGDHVYQLDVGRLGSALMPPQPTHGERLRVYATRYYPGVGTVEAARRVSVGTNEQRLGTDISLALEASGDISGRVLRPDGQPAGRVGVHLRPRSVAAVTDAWALYDTVTALSDSAGHFRMLGVPAGDYLLYVYLKPKSPAASTVTTGFVATVGGVTTFNGATRLVERGNPPDEPTLSAHTPVTAEPNTEVHVPDVMLRLGGRLTGRVQFQGVTAPQRVGALSEVSVRLVPLHESQAVVLPPVTSNSSGQFEIVGHPPGRYTLQGATPQLPGWKVKSVVLDGRDVTGDYFTLGETDSGSILITMTDRPAHITGTVQPEPTADKEPAVVVLLPPKVTRWIEAGMPDTGIRTVRVDQLGRYSFRDLAPGAYVIAAIEAGRVGDLRKREFVEAVVRLGLVVSIIEGESVDRSLRVLAIR